ncbi:GTP cyclohydrolase 1 type 2 [Dyadobacter sp. CECT 9275]|uniref:GTP cyclohydrolase 1 type 2 homolog n=1 Tax=Dyadobacter helix TaxID=2822344 RepID=A0A916NC64_9BACT|nr:Nif3-like dinuclear metal center hexameric protein [Dyadobacter sp. CECT 9275]CAG5002635.1 GTP cyclohydrolase 1 type 2 [Dyadobacter sp. CECT 9275]
MQKIKDILTSLESLAPPSYQENYDNAGLIVGDKHAIVTGVLITLDVTEAVVQEAVSKKCNLIIAHHPIVFKGLKKLTGSNYVERTVLAAIKNDVAIYAIHTNLDHVLKGVNSKIAEKIGLKNIKILAPKKNILQKLVTFVPTENSESVLEALFNAGAGEIGAYKNCSFSTTGTGTFLPGEAANPAVGTIGKREDVRENRLEVIFPSHLGRKILTVLKAVHPYEEVAYYLQELENENQEVGAGMVGELEHDMQHEDFLQLLRSNMQLRVIRHTAPVTGPIRRVAVCGGAGSFLLPLAIGSGADVFITADYKYHEFFDADQQIMICDIGHYESEVFTKDLLYDYLSGIFSNFALCLSEINTNPVHYFL